MNRPLPLGGFPVVRLCVLTSNLLGCDGLVGLGSLPPEATGFEFRPSLAYQYIRVPNSCQISLTRIPNPAKLQG